MQSIYSDLYSEHRFYTVNLAIYLNQKHLLVLRQIAITQSFAIAIFITSLSEQLVTFVAQLCHAICGQKIRSCLLDNCNGWREKSPMLTIARYQHSCTHNISNYNT